jgi:hypothetical protein
VFDMKYVVCVDFFQKFFVSRIRDRLFVITNLRMSSDKKLDTFVTF